MKAFELRQKSPEELSSLLTDLKKEQFNLRFQRASGQLENTSRVRAVRREIARIRTVLTQKAAGVEIAAPKQAEKKAKKAPAKKAAPKKEAKKAAPKKEAKAAPKKATKTAAKKPTKAPAKKAAKK